jgi:hypothetical protein
MEIEQSTPSADLSDGIDDLLERLALSESRVREDLRTAIIELSRGQSRQFEGLHSSWRRTIWGAIFLVVALSALLVVLVIGARRLVERSVEMQTSVKKLDSAVTTLHSAIGVPSGEDSLSIRVSRASRDVAALSQSFAKLQADLTDLKSDLAGRDTRIDSIAEKVDRLIEVIAPRPGDVPSRGTPAGTGRPSRSNDPDGSRRLQGLDTPQE